MSKKEDKTLAKCDELIERLQGLKKALTDVRYAPSTRKLTPHLGTGWSQDQGTGAFHHGLHGVISTFKNPEGMFEIKHGGRPVGRVNSIADAGAKIANYVSSLDPGTSPSTSVDPMAIKKDEDGDVEKSGYGPKGGGQYTPADNARRKVNNTGDVVDTVGTNKNVKSYTGRATVQKPKVGPAGPAKVYSSEQIAAINEARKLKKTAETQSWVGHSSIPSADEEVLKLTKTNPPEVAENIMANQLANMMQGKAMLGNKPPQQPTDEQMFGHLVPSEEMLKTADQQWANPINNWLAEASKPISARFGSPEEEEAYWASLRVSDRDDGKSGY